MEKREKAPILNETGARRGSAQPPPQDSVRRRQTLHRSWTAFGHAFGDPIGPFHRARFSREYS